MDDLTALLAAVITFPDEDTPRLMYADALTDKGGGEQTCSYCNGVTGTVPCVPCGGTGREKTVSGVVRGEYIRRVLGHGTYHGYYEPKCKARTWSTCYCRDCCDARDLKKWEQAWLTGTESVAYVVGKLGVQVDGDFGWDRGFVRQWKCDAPTFLRHADALIWHPTQVQICPTCRDRYAAINDKMRKYGGLLCTGCGTHHPPGSVPRPLPPTAQPIRRVVLTTTPTDTQLNWMGELGMEWEPDGDHRIRRYGRWPGVEFVLPSKVPEPQWI